MIPVSMWGSVASRRAGGTSFSLLAAGGAMYCGAMLLFLVGSPTMARIKMGRWVFGAAVGLMIAGIVVTAVQEGATESDTDIARNVLGPDRVSA